MKNLRKIKLARVVFIRKDIGYKVIEVMRIISGSFRGKKIFEPKDIKTRPLKDLTKESIFNIINHFK